MVAALVAAFLVSMSAPPGADDQLVFSEGPGIVVTIGPKSQRRVLEIGDTLPVKSTIEVAGKLPVQFRHGSNTIDFAGESRADVDIANRKLSLHSGRVFVNALDSNSWTVITQRGAVRFAGSTVGELAVAGHDAVVNLVAGSVQLDDKKMSTTIEAPATVQWRLDKVPAVDKITDAKWKTKVQEWTVRPKKARCGRLGVEDSTGNWNYLQLERYHVNVVVHPPVALVQIDQSFFNPGSWVKEGEFVFDLPESASISRFAMYVTPTNLLEGELIGRERASNIYESIVRRQKDPAILEQIGANLFRMRVFPIEARNSKRILLDYTVPISSSRGEHRFRLPLLAEAGTIKNLQITGSILGGFDPVGMKATGIDGVAFNKKPDGSTTFRVQKENHRPNGDLLIRFPEKSKSQPEVRQYAAEDSNAPKDAAKATNYFMVTVPAVPDNKVDERARTPVDLLILADTSFTADQDAQWSTRQIVDVLASQIRPGDRVRIDCLDAGVRPLGTGFVESGTTEHTALRKLWHDQIFLGRGDPVENLIDAFDKWSPTQTRRRVAIYVGDMASLGRRLYPEFVGSRRSQNQSDFEIKTPAVATAIGKRLLGRMNEGGWTLGIVDTAPSMDVRGNRRFAEQAGAIAKATGGRTIDVSPAGGTPTKLVEWLHEGLPNQPQVVSATVPGAADLFASTHGGDSVQVFGKIEKPGDYVLSLATQRNGKATTRSIPLKITGKGDDIFVGRMWAQELLQVLLSDYRPDNQETPLSRRITELSQEWTLLSPLTAFLVLETEEQYAQYKIDRHKRRRYWQPGDTVVSKPLKLGGELGSRRGISEKDKLDRLAKIKSDLENRDALLALLRARKLLDDDPKLSTDQAVDKLLAQVEATLTREKMLHGLGARRLMFERPLDVKLPSRGLNTLIQNPQSTAFGKLHPLAKQMLKMVEPPRRNMTYRELFDWLSGEIGLPIEIDPSASKAIAGLKEMQNVLGATVPGNARDFFDDDEKGDVPAGRRQPTATVVGLDKVVDLTGIRRISIRNLLHHALTPNELFFDELVDRVQVTDMQNYAKRNGLQFFYDVADLFDPYHPPAENQLAAPYDDADRVFREKAAQKLRLAVSASFDEVPFMNIVEFLSELLDENVVVDETELKSLNLNEKLSIHADRLPVAQFVRKLTSGHELAPVPMNGVIRLADVAKTSELLTEFHFGGDLVKSFAAERPVVVHRPVMAIQVPGRSWGRGGGGLGGGGGGRGGGGFGGGGVGFDGGGRPPTTVPSSNGQNPQGNAKLTSGQFEIIASNPFREQFCKDFEPEVLRPSSRNSDFASVPVREVISDVHTNAAEWLPLIERAVEPNSWENNGGEGRINYFSPTGDFIAVQTLGVHQSMNGFMDELRAMLKIRRQLQPPASSLLSIDRSHLAQLEDFSSLIQNLIEPGSWEDAGGEGSIAVPPDTRLLHVYQTAQVHEKVHNLIVQLKRRRNAMFSGERPWNGPTAGVRALLDQNPILTRLPSPEAGTIARMGRDSTEISMHLRAKWPTGDYRFRHRRYSAKNSQMLEFKLRSDQIEFDVGSGPIRIDGELAAVSYPELTIVEIGRWGPAALEILDAAMPWLPHRDNSLLDRDYQVTVLEKSDVRIRVRLQPRVSERRLSAIAGELPQRILPTLLRSEANPLATFAPRFESFNIDATFSAQTNAPVEWIVRIGETLQYKLVFQYGENSTSPVPKNVVLHDAAGKEAEVWVLDQFVSNGSRLPSIDRGWDEYLVQDRRSPASAETQLDAVSRLIRTGQEPQAAIRLESMLRQRPNQPLLALLKVWCERDGLIGEKRERAVELLKKNVAFQGSGAMLRFVATDLKPYLEVSDLYEILFRQPSSMRTVADWERFALAAAELGKFSQAIPAIEEAMEKAGDDGAAEIRFQQYLDLLLFDGRQKLAGEQLDAELKRTDLTAEYLMTLADIFEKHGMTERSSELVAAAFARKGLTTEERVRLLQNRMHRSSASANWLVLLAEAEKLPLENEARRKVYDTILGNFTAPADVGIVATLAQATGDDGFRARLSLRQTELSRDRHLAGDLYWQLFQDQRLPADRVEAMVAAFGVTGKDDRIIAVCERAVRCGIWLDSSTLSRLAAAYRSTGRAADARRAESM